MESIGINLAQERYSGKFFSNGGHVSATIETDNVLKDDTFTRLEAQIKKNIGGLDNAHRIAILEAGLKLKPTNITNIDAQLLEGKRFSVEEWARWLSMPPHKLKEMTNATFSNIEHQNIEWAVDTITPWLTRFEQEYNRKLFRNKRQFYTKHVISGLLRGDQKSRYDSYAIGRNWGWLSANDVNDLEDRNPLPGDLGDIYLVPGNMTRAEDAGQQMQPKPEPPAEPEEDERTEELTRSAAARIVGYEYRRQGKGDFSYSTGAGFKAQLMDWMKTSQAVAEKYIAMTAHLSLIADECGATENETKAARVALLTDMVMKGATYEAE
jgi:hypothetical protein